jgi:hypothetical protein
MSGINMKSGLTLTFGLVVLLAGCAREKRPVEESAPAASVPVAQAVSPAGLSVDIASHAGATPLVAAQAQHAERKRERAEPALSSMALAGPPQKMGVPVDLRYQFDGEVKSGQPVTLHLAAVPRVAGSNLNVSIKNDPRISVAVNALSVQKASASTAYRQQVSVTKLADGPAALRVLVTMETSEGSAHGWFSVPLNGTLEVNKQKSVKLE